jgi:chromosome segregation ATPase
MPSPTRGPLRRRQRSARAALACLLLAIGVLAVVGAALSGSWPLLTSGAAVGVALGALATRITWLEVLQSRREAATDRAALAQEYRSLAAERVDENALFAADLTGRIGRHEATIDRLEKRLAEAAAELGEAQRSLDEALDRVRGAEDDNARLVARLEDAEERAAMAIVRVAELEQERDVLVAEWQAADARERFAAG